MFSELRSSDWITRSLSRRRLSAWPSAARAGIGLGIPIVLFPIMSIIIPFGIRTMGWCDYFEDESGHEMCVATQYFHIFFIPLIPLSSMLCVDVDEAPCGGCCGTCII